MQLQIQFEIQQLSVTNYNYLDHLNEVDKENILVLVAEAINVIVDHPGVVVDCKPDHNNDEQFSSFFKIGPKWAIIIHQSRHFKTQICNF